MAQKKQSLFIVLRRTKREADYTSLEPGLKKPGPLCPSLIHVYCYLQGDVLNLDFQNTTEHSSQVRKGFFRVITQRVVVIPSRRFGATYRSHPFLCKLRLGLRALFWILEL
jgi:hypothetical protein